MTIGRTAVAAVALFGVLGVFGVARAQQPDIARELEEAKALYREARFAQALTKLQAVVSRIDQLRDAQAWKIPLADAHLHLALSYVALNDPGAAKESLKAMLRADPAKRLDPQVYAPKVIELFEEARAEVAKEPAKAAAAPAPASSPQAAVAKKGGSKAPLILLGAAAAAGGGIAVAKGGGGSTGATSAATPTATPAPTVSGSQDIALISTAPPPGSTISLSSGRFPLVATLSVVNNATGNYCVQLLTQSPGHDRDFNDACLVSEEPVNISLVAGQAQTVTVPIQLNNRTSCTVPFTVFRLNSCLLSSNCFVPVLFCRQFSATYTFVP